jgi:hypothetical protein
MLVSCPNDCSGHGVCTTMRDLSVFDGPDYDPTVTFVGDGAGVEYTNWDKYSIQVCRCDSGFFGSDCSQGIHCVFGIIFLLPSTSFVVYCSYLFH